MSRMTRATVLGLLLLGATGCYQATIETGAAPSTQVVEKKMASSWLYGIVPPSTVSTKEKCPNGVAKVQTQHSFLNYVVQVLTLGIYTPIDIRATCAQ